MIQSMMPQRRCQTWIILSNLLGFAHQTLFISNWNCHILGLYPANFMHDTNNPSSCPPSLDTIPKLMLNGFASIRETKHALPRNGSRCDARPPLINHDCFVINWPHKRSFFTHPKCVPYLWPIKLVINGKINLPLIPRFTICNKFATVLGIVVK